MEMRKTISILFVSVFISIFLMGSLHEAFAAANSKDPFPSFGSGPIEVRLYSDYYCPPCRATEPAIEPILKDLVKRNIIQLKLIDVPFNKNTPLYARYFLYGLQAKRSLAQALLLKRALYEAANSRDGINTPEKLENFFRGKGIKYSPYDAGTVLGRYNLLLHEDKIGSTPSVVIYRNGMKEKYTEKESVIRALKTLQPRK